MSRKVAWDVVVVGGANTDYLVRGKQLPKPGETSHGDEFQEGPGGKGANQAVAAARLGARVAFIAKIGADERGGALVRHLNTQGVDTRFVVRDADAHTGVALIMVDQHGQKQIHCAPGANDRLSPHDISHAAEALGSTAIVLTQLEVPVSTVAAALRFARQSGARTILDPAPPLPLDDSLLAHVDFIRPNSAEAEVLTRIEVTCRDTARRAALALLDRGARAAAVQAGDEGNLLVWHGGEHFLPKLKVQSVDATGAGDAFAAALAVLLAEGHEFVDAGTFANAAAALATTAVGAQAGLPSRPQVLRLLETDP